MLKAFSVYFYCVSVTGNRVFLVVFLAIAILLIIICTSVLT